MLQAGVAPQTHHPFALPARISASVCPRARLVVDAVAYRHPALEVALTSLSQALDAEQSLRRAPRQCVAGRFAHEVTDIVKHLRRSELRCPIVGITKAGKSAFINALLGSELLPSTNVPSTSFCIRIRHSSMPVPQLMAEGERIAEGAPDILAVLRELVDKKRQCQRTPTRDLVIDTSIPFLDQPSPDTPLRFVLVDTPGVTEASGGQLTRETLTALRESDAAILALNYAELRTIAEGAFLAKCARTRADLFLRPGRNFFCLVTKIDLRNRNGIGPSAVDRIVHEQLADALGERIPTLRQMVLPVRADLAFLARVVASGSADEGQRSDYFKLLFGSHGACRPSGRNLSELTNKSVELSRIRAVENALRDRVAAASISVRHAAVRGRVINLLHRTLGWARRTRRGVLQKKLSAILGDVKAAQAPHSRQGGPDDEA